MEKGGIFLIKVSYSDLGSMYFSTIKPIQLDEVYDYISKNENIEEAVVLWTCNRFEIYFYPGSMDTVEFFDEFLKKRVYKYSIIHGEDAIKHLFIVSSGLDSMVIGENEILGQVKDAWKYSITRGYSKSNLNHIFRKAIEVGKKVRTLHGFNKIKRSVASESMEFIGDNSNVLLVGAGKEGRQIAQLLADRGINFKVTNRTRTRGIELAKSFNVEFVEFDKDMWRGYDTIIIAVNTTDYILRDADLKRMKVKTIIDLSIPSAVENPSDTEVKLINMEKLSVIAEANNQKRQEIAREALKTVETEFHKFIKKINDAEREEFIKKLMRYSEKIIEEEIKIFSKEGNSDNIKEIEIGLKATRNKLLAPLINALKTTGDIKSSNLMSEMERILDEQLSNIKIEKVKEIKGN